MRNSAGGEAGLSTPADPRASHRGASFSAAVDSQTLWDQINALAKILSPVHPSLQNAVLARSVIGMDETHWKLLGEKSESGKSTKRRQVWGIVSDKHVCYRIAEGRSVKDASDVLGDYQGVVM